MSKAANIAKWSLDCCYFDAKQVIYPGKIAKRKPVGKIEMLFNKKNISPVFVLLSVYWKYVLKHNVKDFFIFKSAFELYDKSHIEKKLE